MATLVESAINVAAEVVLDKALAPLWIIGGIIPDVVVYLGPQVALLLIQVLALH